MNNLFHGDAKRDFWVWIDPQNAISHWNISGTGSISSIIYLGERKDNLMFLPNPDFAGEVSMFQIGLLRHYQAEYNFEIGRRRFFHQYPSRLDAIFLLETEEEAILYQESHFNHVGSRILKKVYTMGSYISSIHDSAWVDFCRLPHSIDGTN